MSSWEQRNSYSRDAANKAQAAAAAILQSRGNAPRLFQNTLVFLAVDQARLQDLDDAVRRYLAWSILAEKNELNLDPHRQSQAEAQQKAADGAVLAHLPEAYQWLLAPVQTTPQTPISWQAYRLTGQDSLAARVSKKLRSEELLVPALAGTRLRMELDRVPLWRGDHVAVRQLAEDFARYTCLPRLREPSVLSAAVQDGLGLMLWRDESFAYADSFDEAGGRYRGLRCGSPPTASLAVEEGLLVKPDVALKQQPPVEPPPPPPPPIRPVRLPNRFHGSVALDPARVGRDAGRVADEVIAHLAGLVGSEVTVTLEIEAKIPSGASDQLVRTVTENSRALKFIAHGFERN